MVAVPDIVEAASDADVLVFVIPHQFIERSCKPLVCSNSTDFYGLSFLEIFSKPLTFQTLGSRTVPCLRSILRKAFVKNCCKTNGVVLLNLTCFEVADILSFRSLIDRNLNF